MSGLEYPGRVDAAQVCVLAEGGVCARPRDQHGSSQYDKYLTIAVMPVLRHRGGREFHQGSKRYGKEQQAKCRQTGEHDTTKICDHNCRMSFASVSVCDSALKVSSNHWF